METTPDELTIASGSDLISVLSLDIVYLMVFLMLSSLASIGFIVFFYSGSTFILSMIISFSTIYSG